MIKVKRYFLIYCLSLIFLVSCQTLEKINPVDIFSEDDFDFPSSQSIYYYKDTLHWQKISNFIEYYIYLNGLKISSVKNPYYNYSSLEHGTYNFQVSGKKYFADSTYLIETYKSKVLKVFHYGKIVSNLKASYISGEVILNWDAHLQAKKYYIYMDNSLIDSTINNYYSKNIFFIGSKEFGVCLLRYDEKEDTMSKINLLIPNQKLILKSNLNYVSLSWEAISSASNYYVYRKKISETSYTLITQTTSNNYKDYVSQGVYAYYIRANLSSSNYYDYESKISSSIEKGEIQLSWKYDIISGISGFKIYYKDATTPFEIVAFLDYAYQLITDNYYVYIKNFTVDNFNNTYPMEISAYNSYSESLRASRTVNSLIFSPKNLNTTSLTNSIKISWDHSVGADAYLIYRSTKLSFDYLDSLTLSDEVFYNTEFIDKNGQFPSFSRDTTYYYKLKAKNDTYGFSNFSDYIEGKSN